MGPEIAQLWVCKPSTVQSATLNYTKLISVLKLLTNSKWENQIDGFQMS